MPLLVPELTLSADTVRRGGTLGVTVALPRRRTGALEVGLVAEGVRKPVARAAAGKPGRGALAHAGDVVAAVAVGVAIGLVSGGHATDASPAVGGDDMIDEETATFYEHWVPVGDGAAEFAIPVDQPYTYLSGKLVQFRWKAVVRQTVLGRAVALQTERFTVLP